ncbi:MAG: hypothetical protein DLM72_14385 [Candidatus Nitrosopolaris wilkensis]|nr:MAG: hypothetical protein DLM72_14385 [Candidatus Nitrosopolaris wilkensis]
MVSTTDLHFRHNDIFVGLAFLFGMIAGNVMVLVAGPFLIVSIILMAIGVYLMSKGHKKWQEAKRESKLKSI